MGNVLEAAETFASVNPAPLSKLYKQREVAGGMLRPPIVVRADGVGFGKALREGFTWPRDRRVHEALINAAEKLMRRYSASAAYVVSDEVSVLFRTLPYSGRLFKVVSVMASILSSHTSIELNRPLYFDARAIQLTNIEEFIPYVIFRARVGLNNYVSSLYHSVAESSHETPPLLQMLKHVKEIIRERDSWECCGTLLYRGTHLKEGVNMRTGKPVTVVRRTIIKVNVTSPSDIIKACQSIKASLTR
jgi:hypothetical protein